MAVLRLIRNLLIFILPFVISAVVILFGGQLVLLGLKHLNESSPLPWFDDFYKGLPILQTGLVVSIWVLIIAYSFIRTQISSEEPVRNRFYMDIWTPPVMILWERNSSEFIPHVYEVLMYDFVITNKADWEKYHGLSYEHRWIQSMITTPSGKTIVYAKKPESYSFLQMFVTNTKRYNGLSEYAYRLNVVTEETDEGIIRWDLGNGTDWQHKKRRLKVGINR